MKIKVNNNVRKFRFSNNEMTQLDLAEKVGVSRQTIISIESEKYVPSLELAFKIAEVFKVSIDEIFNYEVLNKWKQ